MPEIKVSDAVAVHATKILEKYCDTRSCDNCVFNFYLHGSCQFKEGLAPIHWTVPTGFEEVGLLVGEAR